MQENEVVKRGTFETKAHGKQQRYFCKSCNKKFMAQTPFYRMKNNPQKITLCLDLFFKGISTRQIQQHLQAFYPHNSSWVTIYRWVVKYSKQISQFTDNLKLKTGEELQVDEMEIGSQKSSYRGWFIDSIDTTTRFIVSSEFAKTRDLKEVKRVLAKAKKKTENQIKIVTSDGWLSYQERFFDFFMDSPLRVIYSIASKIKINLILERIYSKTRRYKKLYKEKEDIINNKLLDEKLINKRLNIWQIRHLVERYSREGIDYRKIFPEMKTIYFETFFHLGHLSISHSKNNFILNYGEFLKRKFPEEGMGFLIIKRK